MEQQPDFQQLAAQLRNPDGVMGKLVGDNMSESNKGMIIACINALPAITDARLLELGPGKGDHLMEVFEKYAGCNYTGVDISETMVQTAKDFHEKSGLNKQDYHFQLVKVANGFVTLPFAEQAFDIAFSVNTIYFWDNPTDQIKELYRALKPNGTLGLAFAHKSFMEQLPFTQFGFELYDNEKAKMLVSSAGFRELIIQEFTEKIKSNAGFDVERTFSVLTCKK